MVQRGHYEARRSHCHGHSSHAHSSRAHLNLPCDRKVFEYDLYEAMRRIMKNKFTETNAEDLPIIAFEQKNNILFVYNNEWTIITPELFNLLFNKLTKGLLRQFQLWQEKNKDRLYENHFSDKYKTYMKKILGGDLTREQQCIKIKHLLYNDIKNNIKNIIHYDFEF
jgi:hypothetical protein